MWVNSRTSLTYSEQTWANDDDVLILEKPYPIGLLKFLMATGQSVLHFYAVSRILVFYNLSSVWTSSIKAAVLMTVDAAAAAASTLSYRL